MNIDRRGAKRKHKRNATKLSPNFKKLSNQIRLETLNSKIIRGLMIVVVLISACSVGFSLMVKKNVTAEALAEKQFQELAKSYYEDFFYDNFVNSHKDEIAAKGAEFVFKPYLKTGFPMVKLRRLLSYSDENNLDKRIYFEHKKLTCNKDLSSVTFKPHAPFGKTDYTTDPILSCQKVEE